MSVKILLTGFEPFGGAELNPSLEAVRIVEKQFSRPDAELVVSPLVVEFAGAKLALDALIQLHNPDIVVCVGVAGGRRDITFERVAINLADARIPDNSGYQPVDQSLEAGGANALFTTLPVKHAVQRLREAGIAASVSYTAGTYVCNAAMYYALSSVKGSAPCAGFIHIPEAFGTSAAMSVEEIARGIQLALDVFTESINTGTGDLVVAMGTEY